MLTCKSLFGLGYRGERLIELSSSWFPTKFPLTTLSKRGKTKLPSCGDRLTALHYQVVQFMRDGCSIKSGYGKNVQRYGAMTDPQPCPLVRICESTARTARRSVHRVDGSSVCIYGHYQVVDCSVGYATHYDVLGPLRSTQS